MIPSASSMPMPHLIFQIDEILRLIAKYVGWVSPPAAIEFARCCRAFEEPALRPLWEYTTLRNLMYVLPKDVLHFDCPSTYVVGFLSPYFSPRLNSESGDLPPAHSKRTLEAISIRVLGQKHHRIDNRRFRVLPPGSFRLTRGRPVPKLARYLCLDRTHNPSFPPPLRLPPPDVI